MTTYPVELADLIHGEACDHCVNVCWRATFDLIARATAWIQEVYDASRHAAH